METLPFWALDDVSDAQLRGELTLLLSSGARTEARIIAHLAEVEGRKLHLREGSASAFEYCQVKLGLSESEAFHRLTAARIARKYPIVFVMVERRQIHLSGVCLLRDYLTPNNHAELLAEAAGKTKLQVLEVLARRFPRPDAKSRIRKLPNHAQPAEQASTLPYAQPAEQASTLPHAQPAEQASTLPHAQPAEQASTLPHAQPAEQASTLPHAQPAEQASTLPHAQPTHAQPTHAQPTHAQPTHAQPAQQASTLPHAPHAQPTHAQPTHAQPTQQASTLPLTSALGTTTSFVQSEDAASLASSSPTPSEARTKSPPSRSPLVKPPLIEPTSEARYRIQLNASAELKEKLELLRALISHSVPSGDLAAVIERAIDLALEHVQKQRFAKSDKPRAARPRKISLRRNTGHREHIPNAVQRAVAARDDFRCTYVSDSGCRCTARAFLQIHHEKPWACGGEATTENLRLLCASHNRLLAEQDFGVDYVAQRQASRQAHADIGHPRASTEARAPAQARERSTNRTVTKAHELSASAASPRAR